MPETRRIYIAGPMSNIPDFNFPAFNKAAAKFRAEGWVVINPAENFGGKTDLPRSEYMRLDILLLMQCSHITFLPGWTESRGALMEYLLAHELGLCMVWQDINPIIDISAQVADRLSKALQRSKVC